MTHYELLVLSDDDRVRLQRSYDDLKQLAACPVPAVRSAARAALAHIAQALNGQALAYELYTRELPE
jgi:hypothetical protein